MEPSLAVGNTPLPPPTPSELMDAALVDVREKINCVLTHFRNNMQIVLPTVEKPNMFSYDRHVHRLILEITVRSLDFEQTSTLCRIQAKHATDKQKIEYKKNIKEGYIKLKVLSEVVLEQNTKKENEILSYYSDRIQQHLNNIRLASEKALEIFHREILKSHKLTIKS